MLAIPPNPKTLAKVLTDQLDAVCLSTTLLQADAYVQAKDRIAVLAAPTLVTVSGGTAFFNVGKTISYPTVADDGTPGIKTRDVGTQISVTPTVLRNGNIRLEVSPSVTLLDKSNSVTIAGTVIPGIKQREAKVAVELTEGQRMMFSVGSSDVGNVAHELLVVVTAERFPIRQTALPGRATEQRDEPDR